MLLMATVFGQNAPKLGGWRKSCNLKYEVKFQQKCWWNRTANLCAIYFMLAPLCGAHLLVCEINTSGQSYKTFYRRNLQIFVIS
jgi:hypothetical protein